MDTRYSTDSAISLEWLHRAFDSRDAFGVPEQIQTVYLIFSSVLFIYLLFVISIYVSRFVFMN